MATTTTGGSAQVVTVYASADATTSSTMSLVYIYSAATTEAQSTSTSSSSSSSHLAGGAIAGIIVGCIAFLLLLALGLFCYSRKIARKRRSERAPSTLQFPASSSRHTLPSRAQSRATTAINSPTMQQVGSTGGGSIGGSRSSIRNQQQQQQQQYARSAPRTPRSPRHHHPKTPTQELPELEGSRAHQSSPNVHEVYGSYVHPVELQAGSMTNLVAEVAQVRKAKVTEKTSITRGEKDPWESGSTGYLSPTWPPPSRGGTASELDGTDSSTIVTHDGDCGYGGGGDRSVQSIHVYFSPGSEYGGSAAAAAADSSSAAAVSRRQSQIAIAKAMSAASSSPSKASRSTLRSSSATNVTR